MNAMAAASTHAVRKALVLRPGATGSELAMIVGNAGELARRSLPGRKTGREPEGWRSSRSHLFARQSAELPVLVIISGKRAGLRGMLIRGAAAVLGRCSTAQAMRAAATAISQGLTVWQPDEEQDEPRAGTLAGPLAREFAVLERVAAGPSNNLIAQERSVWPKRVQLHLQAAFSKLGTHSRAQAVAVAVRHGARPRYSCLRNTSWMKKRLMPTRA